MIEQSDFDAIEREIVDWHALQASVRGLSAEQEAILAQTQLTYLAYVRMWAQRAGVVAEQTQAEASQVKQVEV